MNIKYNKALWLITILAIVMLIPFLGLSDFNTKGEPREAVVAYTMLEHGNWILPINNGGDIPYKPPFFHWCIAFFSLFIGHVNEYTSRLPSAVSLVLMTIGGFVFYAKRKDTQISLIAAILTLTAFEVHRAGINCRVDMVNTAFMVGAMYLLYRWWEKGKHQLPWLAILCMSGATLTKGPVGIILPCFVMGVFMLTQRENFWGIVWHMALTALLSLIIPFCWYYAAYLQGGDEFLRLVKEENIDRFMGKMAYESHENPAWYNLLTLVMGWAPYTLLLLFSLFILPWKKFSKTRFLENAKKATPLQVFTWLAFLLVLFFYCIPKSKRSVYLLPCYPFMAYLIAEYIVWMMKEKMGASKVYAGVIASLAVILVIATLVIRAGGIPDTIFHGKHAADNIAMLHAIGESTHGILFYVCYMFLIIGAYHIFKALKKKETSQMMKYTLVMIIAIFITLDSTLQPAVLNTKADKHLAPVIEKKFDTSKLYSYMSVDMLHFFSLNFYLGDKIQQFDKVLPQDGVLMLPEEDMPDFKEKFGKDYTFQKVWEVRRLVEWRKPVEFYQFVKVRKAL
jgi:4-amino-4-deoxy-L-arabinose transferase-like glycosyltransferase